MKPALLVLDPQNDLFEDDNPNLAEFQATIPVINSAITFFRERHWPLIFVQHVSRSKPEGSQIWAIYEQFNCKPDDIRVCKTQKNAFWNTDLDSLLKSYQVDFVVVAGYIAEHCVLSTLRGALERGYGGGILNKSIASLDNRYTQFTMEILPHFSLDELKANVDRDGL
jgi:nicotinamidase-related amidase